ncbi:NAD(P)-binding protein [Dendryphion nanum]|uniref:NAD(P)-binding protein n=1 Tax=Dendryphion nanum TaxID=256645 RepID=A0A9P9E3V8_9PLEO|nr:NAD(P)-binding protein [Dendryphion nanum]
MLIPEFIYHQLLTTPPLPKSSFAGETIILTGGNRGLGFEAAKHIIRLGVSKLIIAVRSVTAGEEARTKLLKDNANAHIEIWELDLGKYESVKAFAQRAQTLSRLDAVLNNAAIAKYNAFEITEDNETNVTINFVSTFLLIVLLLPKLRESAEKFNINPRVSIVGSEGMNWVAFTERKSKDGEIFKSLNTNSKTTNMQDRYFLTKLLVMLCVRELVTRMENSRNNGSTVQRIIINVPAPGYCATDLAHELKGSVAVRIFEKVMARAPEPGSRCLVDGIGRGKESHGQYLSESKIKPTGKFIRSEEGKEVGGRLWDELVVKLENIQPGISTNI